MSIACSFVGTKERFGGIVVRCLAAFLPSECPAAASTVWQLLRWENRWLIAHMPPVDLAFYVFPSGPLNGWYNESELCCSLSLDDELRVVSLWIHASQLRTVWWRRLIPSDDLRGLRGRRAVPTPTLPGRECAIPRRLGPLRQWMCGVHQIPNIGASPLLGPSWEGTAPRFRARHARSCPWRSEACLPDAAILEVDVHFFSYQAIE